MSLPRFHCASSPGQDKLPSSVLSDPHKIWDVAADTGGGLFVKVRLEDGRFLMKRFVHDPSSDLEVKNGKEISP